MEIYISRNDELGNVTWKMTNSEIEIEKLGSKFGVAFLTVVAILPIAISCIPYFYKNRKIDLTNTQSY